MTTLDTHTAMIHQINQTGLHDTQKVLAEQVDHLLRSALMHIENEYDPAIAAYMLLDAGDKICSGSLARQPEDPALDAIIVQWQQLAQTIEERWHERLEQRFGTGTFGLLQAPLLMLAGPQGTGTNRVEMTADSVHIDAIGHVRSMLHG